jgi:biopolymer transport protein ExbD
MTRAAWVGLVVLLGAGCRSGTVGSRGALADAGGSPAASALGRPSIDEASDAQGMVVVVSKGHLTVDDVEVAALPASRQDAARAGFDRRYMRGGPGDMLVAPLLERAQATRERNRQLARASAATIVAEAATPYRIITQILYTLGYAQFTSFHMMVLRRADEPSTFTPPRPSLGPLVPRPEQRTRFLDLKVSIGHDGVQLATADGPLGTGCTPGASGVTVPATAAGQDLAGVQRCAFQLKATSMADASVNLAATGDTDYGTILDTMDALREVDGQKLFPDVSFGTPK